MACHIPSKIQSCLPRNHAQEGSSPCRLQEFNLISWQHGFFEAFPSSLQSFHGQLLSLTLVRASVPFQASQHLSFPADPVLPLQYLSFSFSPAPSRPLFFPLTLLFIISVQMRPHIWVLVGRCTDSTGTEAAAAKSPDPGSSIFPLSVDHCQVMCPCFDQ